MIANALGQTTPTEAGICPYHNTAALENELEVFKCCELLPLGVATIALFLALITSCFSSAFGLSLPSLLENGWTDNSYVWVMKINARGHPVPLPPPLMVFFLLSFPTKPKTHHNSTCIYLSLQRGLKMPRQFHANHGWFWAVRKNCPTIWAHKFSQSLKKMPK